MSIAFTLAVIVNVAVLLRQAQAMWIGLLPLVPLGVLSISGLDLFALP